MRKRISDFRERKAILVMIESKQNPLTRRLFLFGMLSLGVLFRLRSAQPAANKTNDDELIETGGWILKKSDLL